MNEAGPMADPCTTPALKDLLVETALPRLVQCNLSERKFIIQLYTLSGNPSSSNFDDREACRKVSKALAKSKAMMRT